MPTSKLSVAVVGAGVLGASAAYHLARAGAEVTVYERSPSVAMGVTARAFGWVGTAAGDPSKDPGLFQFRLNALGDFDRLGSELRKPLVKHARGALIWTSSSEATARLVGEQSQAGAASELVSAQRFSEFEPGISAPPEVALYGRTDFAIDAVAFTHMFISAAETFGAELRCGQGTVRVEIKGGRPNVLVEDGGAKVVDFVVFANGMDAAALAEPIGVDLELVRRPAVLIRFARNEPLLRRIICGPEVEIRQALDGSLIAADCIPENGEAGLPDLGREVAKAARSALGLDHTPAIISCEAGNRAIPDHGFPVRGFLPGMPGCYVMVAHPGVILAPFLGRMAAAEITHQSSAAELEMLPFRRRYGAG